MHMPEEVGGGGLDLLPFTIVVEHIENRDPSGFHPLIWDTGSVTGTMLPAHEDEYQRETYFEPMMRGERLSAFALSEPGHGSDATQWETVAEQEGDEWRIHGQKAYISKGAACDFLMVHARTSGETGDVSGITSFLVDLNNPGVTVDRVQRPMGGQPGRQAILNFRDCRVDHRQVLGEVSEGFEQLIGWIGAGRLTIPAMAVGRAQWMLDRSIDYANQRETFGTEIGEYQGVQFPLADLATDVKQARLLYRHAAAKTDCGERAVKEQSMAKLRGSQLWNDAADVAIQTRGGAGFMRSLPFEVECREARGGRIYEGTDEIRSGRSRRNCCSQSSTGLNSGIARSSVSVSAKNTSTWVPISTASGSASTFVSIRGPSSSSTYATTSGRSSSGHPLIVFATEKEYTSPVPAASTHDTSPLKQSGQLARG